MFNHKQAETYLNRYGERLGVHWSASKQTYPVAVGRAVPVRSGANPSSGEAGHGAS
ncbi:hypothetical protein [Paenibacillus sp. 32O-W]|uniref:hypothetical protein n=1 Tax=Paenibacillus sp. 32O-W TaxID=1695218 RepID=UPI0016428507|nr:hypothetical protein [Paenibacillus sp. 32O-W]